MMFVSPVSPKQKGITYKTFRQNDVAERNYCSYSEVFGDLILFTKYNICKLLCVMVGSMSMSSRLGYNATFNIT